MYYGVVHYLLAAINIPSLLLPDMNEVMKQLCAKSSISIVASQSYAPGVFATTLELLEPDVYHVGITFAGMVQFGRTVSRLL
jgi:hypothetical protein